MPDYSARIREIERVMEENERANEHARWLRRLRQYGAATCKARETCCWRLARGLGANRSFGRGNAALLKGAR